MTLPAHLFASDDGALYDTRDPNWSRKPPLRAVYGNASPSLWRTDPVSALQSIKALLRFGPYAWPGGYPVYFVTADGAALSHDAVRAQFAQVCDDHLHDASTGWRIVGGAVNYEDPDLRCDHTGARIPSAYAEPEEEGAA